MEKQLMRRKSKVTAIKEQQLSLLQAKKNMEGKSLLAKKDLETLFKIVQNNRLELSQAFLHADGDSDKINKAKRSARKNLIKELNKKIPGSGNILESKLKPPAEFIRFNDLQNKILGVTNLGASLESAPGELLGYDVFEPPYKLGFAGETLHWILDDLTDEHLTRNSSSLDASGFMSHNFDAEHDSSPIIPFVSWGWYAIPFYAGIDYTIPKTGYLNVTAVARNLHNQVLIAISDKAGLSTSEMTISHEIGLAIVRSGAYYFYPKIIFKDGLINHGGLDQVYLLPGFTAQTPHFLNLTTSDGFLKGETVQIRFYSRLRYYYKTVCMTNFVLARVNWKLDKLYLKMT